MSSTYTRIEVDPSRNMALELKEHQDRALNPGQVRIDVLAATINPADLLTLEGRYGVQPKRPYVPGSECVGIVTEAASDVTTCLPGDLVTPMGVGAWCDRIVCDARGVIKLPPNTDIDQAAMLKANPATALVMLEELSPLSPGDWVLLNAGNSAVGQNVIKLAGHMGLRSAAVVRRPEALDIVKAAGCDLAILDSGDAPYKLPEDAVVRLALDAIGGQATARLAQGVSESGIVATYGLLSGEAPQAPAHDLVFRDVTLRGFWLARWFTKSTPQHINDVYKRLVDLLGKGIVGAKVEARYPLREFEQALSHARSSRQGKILLTGTRYDG